VNKQSLNSPGVSGHTERVTLTQLRAFVLVARLGSVKAAARALGVSEPAVSQALAALRRQLGDPLVVRDRGGMTLTEGGTRLLSIASRMVALSVEAEAAVRAARGAPGILRILATNTITEFVVTPLLEAFVRRHGQTVEPDAGVAVGREMPVLLHNRLADLALGPDLSADPELISEPVFRGRLVAVANRAPSPPTWLVDPSGSDPESETSRLLRRLRVSEDRIAVYPSQTAACAAAADGAGIAIALAHLVHHQVQRGELTVLNTPATPREIRWHVTTLKDDRRPALAGAFRRFLGSPEAMHLMRSPGRGVPPSRFRPPVRVTIWS
jgi:LysR family transcriptional regulator, low CO2-responsive transcriptional regulator